MKMSGKLHEFAEAWEKVCVPHAPHLRLAAIDDVRTADCAPRPAPTRQIWTDGSMQQGDRSGAQQKKNTAAGWAYLVCRTDRDGEEIVTGASAGRVNVTPATEGYQGATRHSNNTAEMTALLEAIRGEAGRTAAGPTEFDVDSLYAVNIATGKWVIKRGRQNAELARRLYESYERGSAAAAAAGPRVAAACASAYESKGQ